MISGTSNGVAVVRAAARRIALLALGGLVTASVAAAPAGGQNPGAPGGVVEVDPASRLIVVTPPSTFASEMIVGYNAPPTSFIFFVDLRGNLVPGLGCQLADPQLNNLVICPPPPQVAGIRFQPPPRRFGLRLKVHIPPLPGGYTAFGGPKRDLIQGSANAEKIKTGKGGDDVNPGKGRDNVQLGAGNDTANTRDGERDVVNGGKGKKDSAKVDRFDKVKNVEKVIRK